MQADSFLWLTSAKGERKPPLHFQSVSKSIFISNPSSCRSFRFVDIFQIALSLFTEASEYKFFSLFLSECSSLFRFSALPHGLLCIFFWGCFWLSLCWTCGRWNCDEKRLKQTKQAERNRRKVQVRCSNSSADSFPLPIRKE